MSRVCSDFESHFSSSKVNVIAELSKNACQIIYPPPGLILLIYHAQILSLAISFYDQDYRSYFVFILNVSDMFVYYNTTKRDFELVTRTEALKEEGFGFYILSTLCQP